MSSANSELKNIIRVDDMQKLVKGTLLQAVKVIAAKNQEKADINKKLEDAGGKHVFLEHQKAKLDDWRLSKEFVAHMYWGPPGSAKTQGIQGAVDAFVKETGKSVKVIFTYLSSYDAVAMRGMPTIDREAKQTVWFPQATFPSEEECAKYDIVVWFFDELSTAPRAVQPSAYRLLQEGQIESYKVPANVIMLAAGNDKDDRAIAIDMSSAMSNRMMHFDVIPTYEPWKKWAIESGNIHPMVIAYHNSNDATNLHRMDPEITSMMKGFPTLRTWEEVSKDLHRYEKDESPEQLGSRVIGHIGAAVGHEFNAFFKIFEDLPNPEKILDGTIKEIPKKATDDIKYATCSNLVLHLIKKSSSERMENFFKYLNLLCETNKEMGYMAVNDLFRASSLNPQIITDATTSPSWSTWSTAIINLKEYE